jgi:quinolinate synthase
MAEKKQWNVRVEDQLIDRLNKLAPKAGFASGNEFAAEALDIWAETLADLMIKLRESERNAVKLQREQLLAQLRQVQESETERRK